MTSFKVLKKNQRFQEMTFNDVQQALEYCHDNGIGLYESGRDEPNLLWNPHWDTQLQRYVWIALRAQDGLKTTRIHLPEDLKLGTKGKGFDRR